MAESKPTKLQMAKEAQKLIDAAGNMSQVMDLDPAIKTDYLIDLKNKTVTVSHLQNVITSLQADIKRDAKEIEPTDKFQPETHSVLADLNVKVPRLVTEKVAEDEDEDEDELESTVSPPIEEIEEVVEKEKPIKKEKKANISKIVKYTRFTAALDAIEELGVETISEELVERSNTLYIKNGGKDNSAEAKWAVSTCVAILFIAKEKGLLI